MIAKYVDLRNRPNIAQAKETLSAQAALTGIEVNISVSRDGLMLYGQDWEISSFLEAVRDTAIHAREYDPTQQPFEDGDI